MRIRLGYVANPLTLKETYSHTMTYQRYQTLGRKKGNEKLEEIIKENFNALHKVLLYNKQNEIYFYRLSHNLIPLATHPNVSFDYAKRYRKEFLEIGEKLKDPSLRVDMHPEQYCVLNSQHSSVLQNSLQILIYHQKLFRLMNLDGKCILHIGSSVPNKEEALQRFVNHYVKLPKNIQKMIYLENDDKTYNAYETLCLCEKLKIPMVFDYHHHICNPSKIKLEEYFSRILKTWEKEKNPPKMHFSSPKSRKEFRSHHFYIDYQKFIQFLEFLKPYEQDIDIMLECKGKDEALFTLIRQLKFYQSYSFEKNTIFYL